MERPKFEGGAEPQSEFLSNPREHAESNPAEIRRAIERVIKDIDFKVLSDIFEEERRRANAKGVSKFCGPGDVDVKEGDFQRVLGINHSIYIEIHSDEVFNGMQRRGKGVESIPQTILSVLSHEEAHSVADNGRMFDRLKFMAELLSLREAVVFTSGYDSLKKKGWRLSTQFSLFNEGVTDLVGEEVFTEYIRRTGTKSTFDPATSGYYESYQGPRAVVKTFIAAIAQATDFPYDIVWNSLKEGYFTNRDLSGSEMYKAFQEAGLRDFVEKMRKMQFKGKHSPLKVLESLDLSQTSYSPEVVMRLQKAIGAYAEKSHGENKVDIKNLGASIKPHADRDADIPL